MDEKLSETTKLCVEIMKSRRQVRGKLGQVVQIRVCRLTQTWLNIKAAFGGKSSLDRFWKNSSQCREILLQVNKKWRQRQK